MEFLNTFRGRLLLILTVLLIATLSVQYYLNLRTQRESNALRAAQEQTIVAAIKKFAQPNYWKGEFYSSSNHLTDSPRKSHS